MSLKSYDLLLLAKPCMWADCHHTDHSIGVFPVILDTDQSALLDRVQVGEKVRPLTWRSRCYLMKACPGICDSYQTPPPAHKDLGSGGKECGGGEAFDRLTEGLIDG